MKAARSFTDILARRGRIVIFTATATVGLRFEQQAERHHAQVVCTRGWADAYGPLGAWQRIHAAREYGVLSCDQQRYVSGFRIPATDLVWIGEIGNPRDESHVWQRFNAVAARADDAGAHGWVLAEDAL